MSNQQPGQSGQPGPGSRPPPGPPYLPQVAQLGGLPTPNPDDIISGVLLAFFVAGAATHMTIFQINRRREHKFIFSVLLFGFCMARIAALVMRIVLASRPTNVSIGIAANIFVAAGVLLLFIVNLLFSQRIVRAYHPSFGWNRGVTVAFRFLLFSVIALLIMVITTTVHSFFTLDMAVRQKEREVALFAGTYLAVLAFLPIPIVIAAVVWPRDKELKIDKFGQGRLRTKVRLLLFTSTLLSLGAGFRIGVNFSPRPITNPAWYHSKAAFYCFNFVIELIVVYVYAIARFDKRFHIPNGSKGPGHYRGLNTERVDNGRGDEHGDGDVEAGNPAGTEDGHRAESRSSAQKPAPGPEVV
ncbi:Protein of unknown function (DUF3112) domain containing protein [Rhypophila decipiens]